jgi:predicted small integral membrane protein
MIDYRNGVTKGAAYDLDQKVSEVALIIRLAKAILCVPLALFGLLVAVDNVVDYGTNYAFVQHVFSMDTTFPGNVLKGRAITDPAVWKLGYGAIMVGEALTGLCFLVAAATLMANLRAPPAQFAQAKTWAVVAGTVGFLVWFLGFAVIGGEWFQMWQSPTWNGQEPAFRFVVTILAVVIFIAQRESDVA